MSVFKGPSHRAQTVQVRFVILTEAPVYVDMTKGFTPNKTLSAQLYHHLSLSTKCRSNNTCRSRVFEELHHIYLICFNPVYSGSGFFLFFFFNPRTVFILSTVYTGQSCPQPLVRSGEAPDVLCLLWK